MQSINVIPSVRGPAPLTSFVEQDPAFAQPTPALVAFTEFYCQSGGSNVNAGSDTNNSAKFTSTNGNWSTVTLTFIPTDGTNPVSSGVKVGDYASIYIDGATEAVFVSRITVVVDAVNGGITVLDSGGLGGAGNKPVTSATARTIKVGGALLGPNAASGFPLTLQRWGELRNVSGNPVRTNFKNNQTYSITAGFAVHTTDNFPEVYQGYSVTPGDGGKATIDGGTSTDAVLTGLGLLGNVFRDLIFSTSISSGTADMVVGAVGVEFTRCVFKGARVNGLNISGNNTLINECEASGCNGSNTANSGCFKLTGTGPSVIRTIAHDSSGSNTSGFIVSSGSVSLQNVICARLGQYGVSIITNGNGYRIVQSDFYRLGSDAIHIAASLAGSIWIENNNFVKLGIGGIPGGAGICNLSTSMVGYSYNNAYGTVATGDTLLNFIESGKITYPQDTTPWVDPDNGNFGESLAAALSTGRGAFTVTQTYSGTTTGYPDIGAAQAQTSTQAFNIPNTTQILSDGFLGHAYNWKLAFNTAVTITLQSGTLPTGLTLTQVDPVSVQLTGTPTVATQFSFTLRATIGTSYGDAGYQLTVNADPDEGIGGLLGGLRPTC